jgi:hypothetical protein
VKNGTRYNRIGWVRKHRLISQFSRFGLQRLEHTTLIRLERVHLVSLFSLPLRCEGHIGFNIHALKKDSGYIYIDHGCLSLLTKDQPLRCSFPVSMKDSEASNTSPSSLVLIRIFLYGTGSFAFLMNDWNNSTDCRFQSTARS